ncbi:MAG: GDSL-type esterase/lipase family protein [Umezawaea sp.]
MRTLLFGVVTAVVLAVAPTAAGAAPSTHQDVRAQADPVRIMPLGDSITQGGSIGGYRLDLGAELRSSGRAIDFVGSLADGPSSMPDRNHEGHPGWTIAQVDANVVSWLRTHNPRAVLLHIGTNDMYGSDPAGAPSRLNALIDRITTQAPGADVFVATIIPIRFADQTVRTFNAAITPIVRAKAAAGRKVHLVDMYPSVPISDLPDGIHPNAAGYAKMATTWYNALLSVPGSIGDGTGQPAPDGACAATPSVTGTWGGGFQGEVTVANTSSAGLSGWTVALPPPNGHTVSQIWGGTASGQGTVTVKNVDYNGSLAAGTSTTFGFIASGSGAAAVGTATCASS